MADLITHGALALLWKAGSRGPHVPSFVAGNLLPDLLSRLPSLALNRLQDRWRWIPDELIYLWGPLHMPAGMLLSGALLAFLFPAEARGGIARALLAGMAMHLGVDLLQYHFGVGYALLFPFSRKTWEIGVLGSEDTVFAAPVLAVLAAMAWRWRRR